MTYLIKNLSYQSLDKCFSFIKNEKFFNNLKRFNGWSINSIESFLTNDQFICLGCYNKNTIVGFIISTFCNIKNLTELEILLIFVDKKHRRKGVGSKLITDLLKNIQFKKKLNIFLEFSESNNVAKIFYEDYGFEMLSKRTNYYKLNNGKKENAIIYKFELNIK